MELASTFYTSTILMQASALDVMQAVNGDIAGRVNGVLRLLKGLAEDDRFTAESVPLFDRAVMARPYKKSYNLFMIAVTDQDVNVASTNQMERPQRHSNLAYRDYMQELYRSGETQITDAFPAGADGKTMNYTIAVPIIKEGAVRGCVFGSIYLEDIEQIINRNIRDAKSALYLLGSGGKLMTGPENSGIGASFQEAAPLVHLWGDSAAQVAQHMKNRISGSYWAWGKDGLAFVVYSNVPPTGWTLLYEMRFSTVIFTLLPSLLFKSGFYLLLCAAIYLFGRRYLQRHLEHVNHLLDRVTMLQRELFQSEQASYDNVLDLTQKGLVDQLTGLSTRTVLLNNLETVFSGSMGNGAVMFLDLDDLKRLNDNFGHEGGDYALIHFAKVLKKYEQQFQGMASRYGGDEFIFILPNVDRQKALSVASRLCADLHTTLSAKGRVFTIHGSIGVALYPQHGNSPEELISKADLALYSAKQEGKSTFRMYDGDFPST